jgi:hypothetical protein
VLPLRAHLRNCVESTSFTLYSIYPHTLFSTGRLCQRELTMSHFHDKRASSSWCKPWGRKVKRFGRCLWWNDASEQNCSWSWIIGYDHDYCFSWAEHCLAQGEGVWRVELVSDTNTVLCGLLSKPGAVIIVTNNNSILECILSLGTHEQTFWIPMS